MKVFISYAFNEKNKWVEELVFPLVRSLGYRVETGQRLEGEVLVEGVDARLRGCTGCIAFTTRRTKRPNKTYETHPWVINELTKARTLNFQTIEVREEGVKIGDDAEAYVRLEYREAERERMLVDLVQKLASWKTQRVRIQLLPPDKAEKKFMSSVVKPGVKCTYEIHREGCVIGQGEAKLLPITGSCFIEIEIPADDVLVQISIRREPQNVVAWASSYTGLLAIPVQLH
jgi:hypothetical protein